MKMLKSCNKVFSDSIEIYECVPLSSDGEQGSGCISVPNISNNTAMIINIKTQCYLVPCGFLWSLRMSVSWLVGFTVFWRGKLDKITQQKLLALSEHLSPSPVFTRSLVLCVILWRSLCVLLFGQCVVCTSSIYGFWLPLWYLYILNTMNN